MRVLGSFLVLFLSLSACAPKAVKDNHYTVIKIYHTNDVHAHLEPDKLGRGGFAYLASVLKVIRKQEPSALILDAGDMYKKGSMPAQLSHDEVTSDLLKQMPPYDARAVGNNEIKVGIPRLIKWAQEKEPSPLLSATFVDKEGKPVFAPYTILKRDGLTIGVIGVTVRVPIEEDVQAKKQDDPRAPYKVLSGDETVLPLIKELRPKVDVLILLSHQLYKENLRWAKEHPEIDLIVSGHAHVLTGDQKKLGENMVVEAGSYGRHLGVVTLVFDNITRKVTSIESTFWPIGLDMQVPDPSITQAIAVAYKEWAPEAKVKIGTLAADTTLINDDNPYEGSLHDWVADVLCSKTTCDLALVNRDMLREEIRQGAVTKEDLFLSAPYDDKIAVVKVERLKILAAVKTAIKDDFKRTALMAFGFSKALVKMAVEEDHSLKNLEVKFSYPNTSQSSKALRVALPLYMVDHCDQFFRAKYCPLPKPTLYGDIRGALQGRFKPGERLFPPTANRIRVNTEEDLPAEIDE